MLSTMSPVTVRLAVAGILDKRGMSTQEFANKAGLTYSQALAYRRNSYTRIDFNTLARICNALEVEPGDIFETVEEPATK